MTHILRIEDVSMSFGGLKAVAGFRLALREGGLQGLIGPNGAGKTTVFNLLTGVYLPQTGTVRMGARGKDAAQGMQLNGMKPHQIAQAGMARTFQNIRLFGDLTVIDNVRIAAWSRMRSSTAAALFRWPSALAEENAVTEHAMRLLERFSLADRATETARHLPYGAQRRLEMARAMALDPAVLLLDEPAAGMNPNEKVALRLLIRQLRDDFRLSILLIEHDMGLVMDCCEQITVLDHGVVIADGTPEQIQGDPKVIEAYLGTPEAPAETQQDA